MDNIDNIQIGDKVQVNQKGLGIPSTDKSWWGIAPEIVDQIKNETELKVVQEIYQGTAWGEPVQVLILKGGFNYRWPVELFEKIEETENMTIRVTPKEKELLRKLLEEHVEQYQDLLAKLS